MEFLNVYDVNKKIIPEKIIRRDVDPLSDGEYLLTVHVWIKQPNGRFLISQRTANKSNPLKWECTAGLVMAGENSLCGAQREVFEELGIKLKPEELKLIYTQPAVFDKNGINKKYIVDVYLVEKEVNLKDIKFQENETCDAKFATKEEIFKMIKNNTFVSKKYYSYLDKVFKII